MRVDQDLVLFNKNMALASASKDWETARVFWQRSINIAQKHGWVRESLLAYRGLGLHYQHKGSFLEAAYYFQKGLLLSEKANDRQYQIETLLSLGSAYAVASDFKRSLQSLNIAMEKAEHFNKKLYLTSINEIGNTYYLARDFPNAHQAYLKCLRLNVPIDSTQQCWFLINLAGTYQELKVPKKSMETYKQLFKYGKFLSKEDSIVSLSRLGQLYNDIGNTRVAIRLANSAMKRSTGNESYYSRSLIYETLAEASRINHDWVGAYNYQSQFHQYRDSLLSQEQRQRLEGVKVGYESEKRRSKLEFLSEEMRIQERLNSLLWMGLILFALLGTIILFFYILVRKKRKQIENQRNEISVLNSYLEKRIEEGTIELQQANRELILKNTDIKNALIKGQTIERQRVASELHDNLGGTLTAIQWYLDAMLLDNDHQIPLSENYTELQSMIGRAYSEVRLLAHHMIPESLEKDGLEEALAQLAVPINKSKQLSLRLEINPVGKHLNGQQQFELYNIALELCTNILKHSHASEALMKLERSDTIVTLTISDNGIGMDPNIETKNMGHRNILARLNSIGGKIQIKSAPAEGTEISIMIPCTNHQAESVAARDQTRANY